MRGSASQIQYGMPASCSAPTEPYKKWLRCVAEIHEGWGTSRRINLCHTTRPNTASTRTENTAFTDFLFITVPSDNQKVFRYSIKAHFSLSESSVPNLRPEWPVLPLPLGRGLAL